MRGRAPPRTGSQSCGRLAPVHDIQPPASSLQSPVSSLRSPVSGLTRQPGFPEAYGFLVCSQHRRLHFEVPAVGDLGGEGQGGHHDEAASWKGLGGAHHDLGLQHPSAALFAKALPQLLRPGLQGRLEEERLGFILHAKATVERELQAQLRWVEPVIQETRHARDLLKFLQQGLQLRAGLECHALSHCQRMAEVPGKTSRGWDALGRQVTQLGFVP